MSESHKWLAKTRARAAVMSEAYRLRLNKLWWLNLMFVVVPAVLSTLAAIVAALPGASSMVIVSIPAASAMAGGAAVLLAIHRALKCEEYQAECLRLSQAYQSLAVSLDSALLGPSEEHDAHLVRLTNKIEVLAESTKAQVPTRYIRAAEQLIGEYLFVIPAGARHPTAL